MSELAIGFYTLPEEFQKVIRVAQERHNITVTPLQMLMGGFSGASIYLVSVAGSSPERIEHYILKLDHKSEKSKSDEIVRYQAAIRQSPAEFADRHIAKMAFDRIEHEGVIAIFYSVAGQSLNEYKTLSNYEKQNQLEMIFASTYEHILNGWNARRAFSQAVHPTTLLEQWLGFRLKPGNQIKKFIEEFCCLQSDIPGFLIQGSVFPNPLVYARNAQLWGKARPIDVAVGLQHGDLNTNNILVKFAKNSAALGGYFLIDFAMFKEAMPLLYDLRYVEMSYLTLRQSQVSLEKLLDLLALHGESDRVDPNQVPIDVAGVCAVIGSTRGVFGQWVRENHPSLYDDLWGQYWLAGVAAGLSYCHKAGLGNEERLAALVYAAANLKRYMALFGIPNPAEGQQLYNPSRVRQSRAARSPVLSSASQTLHNLPTQSTPFIGRKTQIAAARELILSDEVRLITFTGPGGTGKTRLSLQVASEVLDQFRDGVFFVPVAETTNLDVAVSNIAQVLEVREGKNRPLLNALKDYLHDKTLLLILDNFEQLVGASSMTAALLAAAPRLKLLITSRIVLRIRGEHEFPVLPLETPDPSNLPPLNQLQQNESIQLFMQCAQSANPKFILTKENASALAEICQHLDGLPLAIELAAARIKILSPQAMVAKLNDRLTLLTGGARDLPARQQTLRNTLDWSHNLLTTQEKILFARLGIFVGGFSLEAAEAICNSDGSLDILNGVESLLNNSLLRQEEDANGQTRFKMLETIREYALEQLDKNSELAHVKQAHALFYINKIVNEIGFKVFSESATWLDWLEIEHDNIRTVLVWGRTTQETTELVGQMIFFLTWFWARRGYYTEGRSWTEWLLASPAAKEATRIRALALLASAQFEEWQGDVRTALHQIEESLTIWQQLEDEQAMSLALMTLGNVHVNMGNDAVAYPILKEARALFQKWGNGFFNALILVTLGNVALGLGNPAEARDWLEEAYSVSRESGDNWMMSFALDNLGEVARVQGDYDQARKYYHESEALLRAAGEKGDLPRLVHNLGYVALHEADFMHAEDQFRKSLSMFKELGNKRGIAECLAGLAGLRAFQGRLQRGAQLLGAAEAQLAAIGGVWWPADRVEIEQNRALILSKLGETDFKAEYEKGRKMSPEQAFANMLG